MNTANPAKTAETPVIEPTSTVIEAVKEYLPDTEETSCPNCGEQVKAWTCHYCG